MRSVGLFGILLLLSSCGPEDDDDSDGDGTTCQCETPTNGQLSYCGTRFTRIETWTKQQDRSCADTTGGVTIACCPGTIETVMTSSVEAFAGLDILKRVTISYPMSLQGAEVDFTNFGLPETVSCEIECAKTSSPFCATIGGEQREALSDAVSLVSSRIADGQPEVEKNALMDLFGVREDHCERSDLVLEGNLIQNIGEACKLDTDFQAGGLSLQAVSITMPPSISAIWRATGNGEGYFEFGELDQSPSLEIDGYLQHDFGGLIRRINVGTDALSIRTSSGCIGL